MEMNDKNIDSFARKYIDELPKDWRTDLDMFIAIKNAMIEALSFPHKYIFKLGLNDLNVGSEIIFEESNSKYVSIGIVYKVDYISSNWNSKVSNGYSWFTFKCDKGRKLIRKQTRGYKFKVLNYNNKKPSY